jgi:MYXO-CTERM domain-containing protein
MKTGILCAGCLLGLMATSAWGVLPAGSDYSYEGDTLGAPISNFFEGTGANTPTKNVSGGILTLTDVASSGDNYSFARSLNSAGNWPQMDPTFTLDAKMQRGPLQQGVSPGGNASVQLPGFTAYMGSTGRIIVYLGNYNSGQQYVNDSNKLTIYDDVNGYNVVSSANLNVDQFSHIRLVGTGSNQYKVYVNDDPTPIRSGSMTASGLNQLNFGFESVSFSQQMMVDFIRADVNTALDAPPGAVPEPAGLSLLAVGALILRRSRRR